MTSINIYSKGLFNGMKKSKLAVVSFILSLLPIILPVVVTIGVIVTSSGAPIMVQEPLEIVDGEVVGGGEVKNTGKTISSEYISFGSFIGGITYIFVYGLFFAPIFLIPAIIVGVIALIRIRENNLGGKWLAFLGLTISVILLIFLAWIWSTF